MLFVEKAEVFLHFGVVRFLLFVGWRWRAALFSALLPRRNWQNDEFPPFWECPASTLWRRKTHHFRKLGIMPFQDSSANLVTADETIIQIYIYIGISLSATGQDWNSKMPRLICLLTWISLVPFPKIQHPIWTKCWWLWLSPHSWLEKGRDPSSTKTDFFSFIRRCCHVLEGF